MSQRGIWCGYQDSWWANWDHQKITYDELLVNTSTIDPGLGYGLDIDSGNEILLIVH